MSSSGKSWSVTSPFRHSTVWTPVVPMRAVCSLWLDDDLPRAPVPRVSLRLAGDDDGDAHRPPAAREARGRPRRRRGRRWPRAASSRATPSHRRPRVYGETAAADGLTAHEAHLGRAVCGAGRPAHRRHVGRGRRCRPTDRRSGRVPAPGRRPVAGRGPRRDARHGATPGRRCGRRYASRSSTRSTPAGSSWPTRSCTPRASRSSWPSRRADRTPRTGRSRRSSPGSSSRSGCRPGDVGEAGQGRADPDGQGLPHRPARRRARHRLQHLPDVERLPGDLRVAGHRQPGHRQAAPAGGAAAGDHRGDRPKRVAGQRVRPGPRAARRRGRRRGPGPDARRAPRDRDHRLHRRPAVRRVAGARGRRARRAGLHREGRRQHGRRRLDRQPARRAGQPRVLAGAVLRPDVHDPTERLRPRGRHRHRRGPPVVRGARRPAGGGDRQADRRRRPRRRDPRRDRQRPGARQRRRHRGAGPARWRVRGSRAPRGDATPHTPTPSSALRAWWPWMPRARRSTRGSASAR